jgi:arginine-tRNA-protein transferase
MRKIARRNSDLRSEVRQAKATSEQYSLFRSYIDDRHADGGMADMTVLDFAAMVDDSFVDSRIVEYRQPEADGRTRLVACVLTDVLNDGLSMIYSFYDPDLPVRSLGTFMILDHVERARKLSLPYLYLGYWVKGSRKMNYKSRFLPQERLTTEGWLKVRS